MRACNWVMCTIVALAGWACDDGDDGGEPGGNMWDCGVLAPEPEPESSCGGGGAEDVCLSAGQIVSDNAIGECCDGLTAIATTAADGMCTDLGDAICAACGDGECGAGENDCNCPADCEDLDPCVEKGGDVGEGEVCCRGLTPVGAGDLTDQTCLFGEAPDQCAPCGDGTCEDGLENPCNCPEDCAPACYEEGSVQPEGGDRTPACCDDLVAVSCAGPSIDGVCVESCEGGGRICTACGDGICGTGENDCNCPADCPMP